MLLKLQKKTPGVHTGGTDNSIDAAVGTTPTWRGLFLLVLVSGNAMQAVAYAATGGPQAARLSCILEPLIHSNSRFTSATGLCAWNSGRCPYDRFSGAQLGGIWSPRSMGSDSN